MSQTICGRGYPLLPSLQIPGDGSLIRAALNDIARAQNMSQLAREIGMTREGLYKALSNPSFATVLRITRALGMHADHGMRPIYLRAVRMPLAFRMTNLPSQSIRSWMRRRISDACLSFNLRPVEFM